MLKNAILTIFILFILSSCSQKFDQSVPSPHNISNIETIIKDKVIEYKIVANDRLFIELYKYPNISTTRNKGIRVNTDGNISLPLINTVHVGGLTQPNAIKLLESKFKKYLKHPHIYLEVLNKRCYVLGEVNNAGIINLDKENMTIMEAITFAKDFTVWASKEDIMVVTHDKENHIVIRKVDMTNFETLAKFNVIIKPNDIIYVKANRWKKYKIFTTNILSPFTDITKLLSPFLSIKYLWQSAPTY